jgi:hypothetical protein
MEPDDLLCSRNARSRTPLVGRAQWKINQPPSLRREQASLEGTCISLNARSKGQPWPLPYREVEGIGRALLLVAIHCDAMGIDAKAGAAA